MAQARGAVQLLVNPIPPTAVCAGSTTESVVEMEGCCEGAEGCNEWE